MKETHIQFRTAVDVCKRFMAGISYVPISQINPLVGDLVMVHRSRTFELEMQVTSRYWEKTNSMIRGDSGTALVCWLGLTPFWATAGLTEFKKMMKEQGFGE